MRFRWLTLPIGGGAIRRAAVAAVGLLALAGCQGSHEMETARVSGVVTLDDKPLTRGTVMFVPTSGRAGIGIIGPSGEFRLSTYHTDDGALVGHHKVSVSIPDDRELNTKPTIAGIPRRYMSAESSGLVAEVKAGEENVVDLKLTSAPK